MESFHSEEENNMTNYGHAQNNDEVASMIQSFIGSFYSDNQNDINISLLLNSEYRNNVFIHEILRIAYLNTSNIEMYYKISKYIPKQYQYLFDSILNEHPNNPLALYIKKHDQFSQYTNLASFIANDDLESFVNEAKNPQFNYKQVISTGPNMGSMKNLNLKLLQFSALHGSVRCFRHILMHDNEIDELTVKSAIRGKNLEIIRLCQQMNGQFKGAVLTVIETYNEDLFDWLFSNFEVDIPKFDCVVKTGNINAVKYFIDMGLTEETKNKFSMTSLHHAALAGYADICKLLINAGFNVNAKNSDGKTPLMLAAQHNNKDAVQILLDNGASKNLFSKKGLLAKDYAMQNNNLYLSKMLDQ